MSPRSRSGSFNLKVFWFFNENLGIFIIYLLYFYISVLTSCLHVNDPCCASMTNLPRSVSRSQKDKTCPKSTILANFKGICVEFVKLMITMFFYVNMRIFCLVFYMTNFLYCIQSEGRTSKAAKMLQNKVKHTSEQKDQSLFWA